MEVTNWGKYPVVDADMKSFSSLRELETKIAGWDHLIPRGMGRCYGDSALSKHILSTQKYNHLLHFDEAEGILTCQSGTTIEEILEIFVPRGWFVPVTPGTKFVSVGGAIASDVHGKNHHKEGSFSRHVLRFSLYTGQGEVLECSRTENPEVFEATCGGMGLTGVVLDVTLKLRPVNTSFIAQESIKARNLEEIMQHLEASMETTYTVAWIDCLSKGKTMGRSILLKGEHAEKEQLPEKFRQDPLMLPDKRKLNVPLNLPSFTLNPWSVKAFNFLYYNKHKKGAAQTISDYDSYFYPLDSIHNWNRIYGKSGFTQYQFVLPPEHSYDGIRKVLGKLQEKNMGSFLAVLKYFGKQAGLISFPMEGYTLTLDFPINKQLFPFLDQLDDIIMDFGGRLYLTKDVRMKREMFEKTYPNAEAFKKIIKKLDPEEKFSSLQSQRIGLTG